jgi:hypothetical protein
MADVRVNGRRMTLLQSEKNLGKLIDKLDNIAVRSSSCLTALFINSCEIDLDSNDLNSRPQLTEQDVIEARIENTAQLAFESLQVAQEMAELLTFDIKVATLKLWDSNSFAEKEMDTLLKDCHSFLTLGAHPLDLLQRTPKEMSESAQNCLKELDCVAQHVEDATLLAVQSKFKESCHVLVGRVLPTLERWLGMTAHFAQELEIDRVELPKFSQSSDVVPFKPIPGEVPIVVTR